MLLDRKYATTCKRGSIKIAQSYLKYYKNDTDLNYKQFEKARLKVSMPDKLVDEIVTHIIVTEGNYREIDIYKYW